ncbi:hypothetical protein C8R45DRAFT_1013934 [Mycena sanguinolenta]|nr:hypothetical protein C8R45DRAFT_1013934 [Mycena sanguinolenta]
MQTQVCPLIHLFYAPHPLLLLPSFIHVRVRAHLILPFASCTLRYYAYMYDCVPSHLSSSSASAHLSRLPIPHLSHSHAPAAAAHSPSTSLPSIYYIHFLCLLYSFTSVFFHLYSFAGLSATVSVDDRSGAAIPSPLLTRYPVPHTRAARITQVPRYCAALYTYYWSAMSENI